MIYLNIYHRDIGLSKSYLQGYFFFPWLEVQKVRGALENYKMKLEKRRVPSTHIEIIHEIYLTVKKKPIRKFFQLLKFFSGRRFCFSFLVNMISFMTMPSNLDHMEVLLASTIFQGSDWMQFW